MYTGFHHDGSSRIATGQLSQGQPLASPHDHYPIATTPDGMFAVEIGVISPIRLVPRARHRVQRHVEPLFPGFHFYLDSLFFSRGLVTLSPGRHVD